MPNGYSIQDAARMLSLSPARVRAYVRSGVLRPELGERGEVRLTFQDLSLLRMAEGLVGERVSARRVRRALRKVQERLGSARPLSGVQMARDGAQVVVHDVGTRYDAESGQGLLPLSVADDRPAADVSSLAARRTPPRPAPGHGPRPAQARETPEDAARAASAPFYDLGCSLEEAAPAEAIAAYVQALTIDVSNADAHINLGRLLHQAGDLESAEAHYRMALAARPGEGTAAFNLGVVLEDARRLTDAMAAYERALAADPKNADAHYNLARLCERLGQRRAALRHLRAYRDLVRR